VGECVSLHTFVLMTCNRLAMQELGKITGRVDVEELLDIIFRDFCIGK
jgi:tRNA U34 5-carboxymethylaminomethyl modifying GTPase MnmE/TrmE